MARKKNGPVIKKGLDEWMATYSDMVTLLFCFFVLLYASSSQDETKFQYIAQAFATGGDFINTVVGPRDNVLPTESSEGNSDLPPINSGQGSGTTTQMGAGDQANTFEDLYNWVAAAADQSDLSESISVEGNEKTLRISFQNDVLFDPDTATLKASGRAALDLLTAPLRLANPLIKKVEIQGHTAAGGTSPVNDWDLSSVRASTVVNYIDSKAVVDSDKFVSEGYAQYDPIDPLEPAKNRRVEITITRNDMLDEETDVLLGILQFDYNTHLDRVNLDGKPIDPIDPVNDSVIQSVLDRLDEKYSGDSSDEGNGAGGGNGSSGDNGGSGTGGGGQIGPSAKDDLLTIPDDAYAETAEDGSAITTVPEETTEAAEETTEAGS
jgi:chemotaxis protein MotB